MRPPRSPLAVSSVLRWARRRLLLPAGLAVVVGVVVQFSPAGPGSAEAAGGRAITPGKRRDEVVDVYEKVKAAVVNIHSKRTLAGGADDPFRPPTLTPQQVNGMGTGIVLDPRGYILTNFHVVDDVNSLQIRLHDGSGFTARVIATDREADLALLKIDAGRPLALLSFGTSADLMVGEPVIAIGNAYGYEHTVTDGRVSFKGRDVALNKDMGYKGLIQVSAPINPGNSGGPLMNVLGELVGVNVAIRAGAQNIGFALPVDFVIGRAADLVGGRKRTGLRHGLVVKDAAVREAQESHATRTVSVERVEPDSPGSAAGFKPGDVIEQVDDVTVYTSIDLERALLDKPAGAKAAVRVRRAGAAETLELVLQPAAKAPPAPAEVAWKRLGLRVQPVGAEAVAKANAQLHGGLLVTEVAVGGAAATAGILKGDILVGLHQWETLSVDNVAFVLNHKDFASFLPLKFYVSRGEKLRDGWINAIP
jgi:serine protease Do